MDKILLWDSDPGFRTALSKALSCKAFKTVVLDDPSQIARALMVEKPELAILEGDWPKGFKISFGLESLSFCSDGELAIILPSLKDSAPRGMDVCGMVLENLRKPFGGEELLSGIHSAFKLKEHIENEPLPWEEYLELRRLRTEEEILSALRLRYEVYREVGFIGSSDAEIEIDRYDTRSTILGAFLRQNGARELVGSLRIIRADSHGPHQQEISAIMRDRQLRRLAADNENSNLPAFASFGIDGKHFSGFFPGFGSALSGVGLHVSGEICELSRLVIKQEYRKNGFGIERKLFNLVVIDSCAQEPKRNWFVIAIHPDNRIKFERFGFSYISPLGVASYTGISQPAILMGLDLQQYLVSPNPFAEHLDLETMVYRSNGKLLDVLHERTYHQEKVAEKMAS